MNDYDAAYLNSISSDHIYNKKEWKGRKNNVEDEKEQIIDLPDLDEIESIINSFDSSSDKMGGLPIDTPKNMWLTAKFLCSTGMVPSEKLGRNKKTGEIVYLRERPDIVYARIEIGKGLRLSLNSSIEYIRNYRGKTTIIGDGFLTACVSSPDYHYHMINIDKEKGIATCTMKRKSAPEACVRTFSLEEAKERGLLSKKNWTLGPMKMLQRKAINECGTFTFPDALHGVQIHEVIEAEPQIYEESPPRIEPQKKIFSNLIAQIQTKKEHGIYGMPSISPAFIVKETGGEGIVPEEVEEDRRRDDKIAYLEQRLSEFDPDKRILTQVLYKKNEEYIKEYDKTVACYKDLKDEEIDKFSDNLPKMNEIYYKDK